MGDSVFQIRPVLPSEVDKKACGRANNRTSPFCRSGLFPATSEFLNFSKRTIIKGDMAIFVKQCQNHVFPLLIGGGHKIPRVNCAQFFRPPSR